MWPTIFTLTSLTSNPQFWHVLIQFSLLYTFRNYILSNSRHLHHLFFIINFASFAKNIFPSLKNEKHFYFGLNIYNRMSKCSIKTKCEIKKKPFVKNSHTKFWLSAFPTLPPELHDDAHQHRLLISWCKPALFESHTPQAGEAVQEAAEMGTHRWNCWDKPYGAHVNIRKAAFVHTI